MQGSCDSGSTCCAALWCCPSALSPLRAGRLASLQVTVNAAAATLGVASPSPIRRRFTPDMTAPRRGLRAERLRQSDARRHATTWARDGAPVRRPGVVARPLRWAILSRYPPKRAFGDALSWHVEVQHLLGAAGRLLQRRAVRTLLLCVRCDARLAARCDPPPTRREPGRRGACCALVALGACATADASYALTRAASCLPTGEAHAEQLLEQGEGCPHCGGPVSNQTLKVVPLEPQEAIVKARLRLMLRRIDARLPSLRARGRNTHRAAPSCVADCSLRPLPREHHQGGARRLQLVDRPDGRARARSVADSRASLPTC